MPPEESTANVPETNESSAQTTESTTTTAPQEPASNEAPQTGFGDPAKADTGVANPDQPQIQFPEEFPEELRAKGKKLMKFCDKTSGKLNMANLAKSYLELEACYSGKGKMVSVPTDGNEEGMRSLYQELGLPTDIEGYKVENNLQDGDIEDKGSFDVFKKAAFDAGILPQQAQKVLDTYNAYVREQRLEYETAEREAATKERNILRGKWGQAYDYKVQRANNLLFTVASNKEVENLKAAGLLSTPMLQLFDRLADKFASDTIDPDNVSAPMTPEEEHANIIKTMSDPAFTDINNPNYQYLRDKVNRYFNRRK